jgi:hypothetical protein
MKRLIIRHMLLQHSLLKKLTQRTVWHTLCETLWIESAATHFSLKIFCPYNYYKMVKLPHYRPERAVRAPGGSSF